MAIHVIPALACAAIVVLTGLTAAELGGGRVAQLVAGVAALFALAFVATGSLFSMDVLDQLWWALASLVLSRLLRRDAPRLWLLVGLVIAIALLTKLTVFVFCLAGALALVGVLLAPDVMPILPPATLARVLPSYAQTLGDRFGWDSLTRTVEQAYAALPPEQRAQACVMTSNYGEAGALSQLAAPGRLPPIISGHNNYYLWGPGTCTGDVLILVGYSASDVEGVGALYADIAPAAVERCRYCAASEANVPIYVLSGPKSAIFPQKWSSVKHYD